MRTIDYYKDLYGIKTDRNGYGKSIMMEVPDYCYCQTCENHLLVRHEVIYGTAHRKLSKLLGLWIAVCPEHHFLIHNPKEKADKEKALEIKAKAQELLDKKYGEGTFFEIFGRNYL